MKISKNNIEKCDTSIFGDWILQPKNYTHTFNNAIPYEHIIIDNFLKPEIAEKISDQYPKDLNNYHQYNNPLEIKYAYDNIDNMSSSLQNVFYALSSERVISALKIITGKDTLEYDPTCHGGGIHIHPNNGRLHIHLDYEKHPLLENKQRYVNIILYLSKEWNEQWGGHTELWNENMTECKVKSPVIFNTALIFKTTEKSWHGLPTPIECPEDKFRKSLAFYYLIPLENNATTCKEGVNETGYRTKAVFTKRPEDPYDPLIEKLYKIRPHRRIEPEDLI
jgi:Rps23 Pro-64 3,4-dihydroxylase Tpa1-like proline 4-hydroxylase